MLITSMGVFSVRLVKSLCRGKCNTFARDRCALIVNASPTASESCKNVHRVFAFFGETNVWQTIVLKTNRPYTEMFVKRYERAIIVTAT